jgi:hypothetical protein
MTNAIVSIELENITCWCGAPMALPKDVLTNARNLGTSLYCPATGHTFGWKSENEKLRKRLVSEETRRQAVEDQLRASERRTAAVKGELTKARKRAQAGVCPCCKRSFVQLARHMSTKQ